MFDDNNAMRYISGRPELEGYRCARSYDVSYHEPDAMELTVLSRGIANVRSLFTFAFIFTAALVSGTLIVFSIVQKTMFGVYPALAAAAILLLIAYGMNKKFSSPTGVAYGKVICHTPSGTLCIAVSEDKLLVTNLASRRGESPIADNTDVAILQYGATYCVCPADKV